MPIPAVLMMLVLAWLAGSTRADDTTASEASPPAVTIASADVQGKPEQDLVKVQYARYFVWQDSSGWHMRTASRGLTKFTGAIKIESGSFGKLRPIGLEAKARNPDRWAINDDRTEIRFEIHTAGSFDGFDFDIRDGDGARVAFDLKLGRNDKYWPKRVYLGRDSKHPQQAHFECPADPERAEKPPAEQQSSP